MKKLMCLKIFKNGNDVYFSKAPVINSSSILKIEKASTIKTGDVFLKFDEVIKDDTIMFAAMALGYDKNGLWEWCYMNSNGTPNEIKGKSEPTEFYSFPIPYNMILHIGRDDFNGDIMYHMEIYKEDSITNRPIYDNDKDINYLLEDMEKYNKSLNRDLYSGLFRSEVKSEFKEYYNSHLPVDLLSWCRVNEPMDNMIYKDGYWDQIIFVRDTVMGMMTKNYEEYKQNPAYVISTHTSKSILLPVYKLNLFNNSIQIVMRNNFYDWKVSVRSEKEITYDFMNLFKTNEKINSIYCEGFKPEWAYDCYDNNKKQFTFEIVKDMDLYMFMKILKYHNK